MATLTLVNPSVKVSGAGYRYSRYKIASGASWTAGQFVRLNSAGLLVAYVADDTLITGIALETVTDPGNNTTTADIFVLASDTELEGQIYHVTPASALADQTVLGLVCDLWVASNVVSLDIAGSNNISAQITKLLSDINPTENSTADLYGRVRFKIISSVLEADAPA